jgi:hypothetical protein
MQLLRLAEVPLSNRDRVYCYSRARALFGMLVLLTTAANLALLSWFKQNWLGYYVAAVILIGLLIYQKTITARFQPSNWLVRMTDHGLYVQFRSYLNRHFPAEDYTVVFLPHAEIRSVKLVNQRRSLPDHETGRPAATTSRKRQLLELELAGDLRQLAIALATEQETVLAKTRIGAEKPSTRYHHFPVELVAPDRLRIEWGVELSVQTILEALTRHTLLRPAEELTQDLVNDYDLTTAKDFVEGLAGKPAQGKHSRN